MDEVNEAKCLDQVYRDRLKEYCGQIPYLDKDNRIRPMYLEEIYTPLRIHKGKPVEDDYGVEYNGALSMIDDDLAIKAILERLDRQIDMMVADHHSEKDTEKKSVASDLSDQDDEGKRISTVYARPGGGKTTWSKRVCLACLADDEQFFYDQLPLKKWKFKKGFFPLFLCCRNMSGIGNEDISDFFSLVYALTILSFGQECLQSYSIHTFQEWLKMYAEDGSLLLVIDGWDEFANEKSEKDFEDCLKAFLVKYPEVKCVITTRGQQKASEFLNRWDAYTIDSLNQEEVRLFCKRWHEEIFRGDSQLVEKYKTIIKQLESPFFSRISYMTKTPYLLSTLLRCSQYYGRLPSSIAELYERSIDMMIGWFTKLDTDTELNPHDVKIQLAYIAFEMAKKRRLMISKNELCKLIGQCYYDLDGLFRRPLRGTPVEHYLTQFLSRNCILENYYGEHYHFPHREMQDYFSAMAIVNGYLDAENNTRDPFEIIRAHYTNVEYNDRYFWETIIIFSTLISGPRFARSVVADIIKLIEKDSDSDSFYRNLLFSFVLNSVDLLSTDRLRIYEICFAKQISAPQIKWICQLSEQNEVDYSEFTRFIESKFKESVREGDLLYCFVWPIIHAKKMADQGINPLHAACKFLTEGDTLGFVTGLTILDLFSWCKYEDISGNEFFVYYREKGYQIPQEGRNALKKAFEQNAAQIKEPFIVDIARTLYSCVLATYLSDSAIREIVPEEILFGMLDKTSISVDNRKTIDYLLAVYPVLPMEDILSSPQLGSEQVRAYYSHQFEDDWTNRRRDSLAFSFNRGLVTGAWKTEEEIIENLKKVESIELDTANKTRISQIQKELAFFSMKFGSEEMNEYLFYVKHDQFSVNDDQFIDAYINSLSKMKILPDGIRITIQNNIAYLVRRGDLRCVLIDKYEKHPVKAEELLKEGISEKDGFSLINYALAISGFNRNSNGSYEMGLNFLQDCFSPPSDTLNKIKQWWWNLAKENEEIEGMIVFLWLFELGCLDLVEESVKENEYSYNDVIFLLSRFGDKLDTLGNHCKNTLLSLNNSCSQNGRR